jgi:hypothetical protein
VTPSPPCRLDPDAWDIPYATDSRDALRIRHRVADALLGCAQCPLREACAAEARAEPPHHPCVQGGLIWNGKHRQPVPFRAWRPTLAPSLNRAAA